MLLKTPPHNQVKTLANRKKTKQNNRENSTSKQEECKTSDVSAKTAMFATHYKFQCYHCYNHQTEGYSYETSSEKEYDEHIATEHQAKNIVIPD